jgi:hypothetical protein
VKKVVVILFVLIILFFISDTHCLNLQRVILSTDDNPNYIQFWPVVAQAWQEIVHIKPTLALVAPAHVKIDETIGDVIRFEPIPGIPTALQAQVIRLLLPVYFPDDGCIISDIDMIPLSKNYFVDSIKEISEDNFVVYRDKAYLGKRFPMCYIAAKGNVFQKVFRINSIKEIPQKIIKWNELQLGWNTDELLLFLYLKRWDKYNKNCTKLGHNAMNRHRIDRFNWHYEIDLLKNGFYIDAHCPRPYQKHRYEIDFIVNCALEQVKEKITSSDEKRS